MFLVMVRGNSRTAVMVNHSKFFCLSFNGGKLFMILTAVKKLAALMIEIFWNGFKSHP
jgi:hypothetical protein